MSDHKKEEFDALLNKLAAKDEVKKSVEAKRLKDADLAKQIQNVLKVN